jgi:outer membrane protein OmpA-like peptidoglycan-associated protein
MKRILLLIIGLQAAMHAGAQTTGYTSHGDSLLSRWVIDVNAMGGILMQDYTTRNTLANYPNAVNSSLGEMSFNNGGSIGGDLQVGFFWGKKRHFGVGTGINYMYQFGDAGLKNYHVEYQATDYNGNIYRQVVSSNYKVSDNLTINNLNVPLVLKYKNRFSKHWGFTADAGAMFNLQMVNDYKTNGSFNYEAIYKFTDGSTTVYDNSPVPASSNYFITKAEFLRNNPNGNVQAYFDNLRAQGNNVGLNVTANQPAGKVTYKSGSVGLLLRPAINLFLSDHVALNFGVYYVYQTFKNDAMSDYVVTRTVGDYNSSLKSVSSVNTHNVGLNVGARFFLGKVKDRDHDGIADRKDRCPDDSGNVAFQGCPDRDGDGIIDKEDQCPDVKGLLKYHGCPDTDGDGIIDQDDACPLVAGLPQFRGCPDRDGDGVPDKDDECPDVAGLPQFHGCPDTDGDGIPDNEDRCPTVAGPASNNGCPEEPKPTVVPEDGRIDVSTPILFNINKTTIHKSSMPILQQAAKEVNEYQDAYIHVDGHADATGTKAYNQKLSVKRAAAVKQALKKMGVNPRKVRTAGHGESHPPATNKTPEGRMQNRRAVMEIKSSK